MAIGGKKNAIVFTIHVNSNCTYLPFIMVNERKYTKSWNNDLTPKVIILRLNFFF